MNTSIQNSGADAPKPVLQYISMALALLCVAYGVMLANATTSAVMAFHGIVFSLAAPAAQEPETQATLQLSLEEVVLLASEQAPALAQARLRGLAADGGVMEAGGAFDPVLFADVTYSFAESPANGFFSSFGTTKSKRFDANQGIRKALTSGGSLSLGLSESYNDASFLAKLDQFFADGYFDDFHANAVHLWQFGVPSAMNGWRAARPGARWLSWLPSTTSTRI